MTCSGGAALVSELHAQGVEVVFGIPGTHNLSVYAALAEHGIQHVLPRHEQGAGYAADGYARASGRPGVCLTTTGPAVLNASAAASQAYSDSIPVLFISPGMPVQHPGLGDGTLHEVKNQSAAMAAVTARSHRVTRVEEIPVAVAQAFATMRTGRPRPVHLEIPLDLLEAEAEVEPIGMLPVATAVPATDAVDTAAAALERASTPLILVGGGASHASRQVTRTAELLGAPVLASCNGKGIVSERHPLSLGAGPQHKSAYDLVREADVVLAVGTELSPADWWLGPPPIDGTLIRIDIDPDVIVTNLAPSIPVVGDAGEALDAIIERVDERTETGTESAARWRARLRDESGVEGEPWSQIIDAIDDALPEEGIVAADSAMVCYYGALSNLPLHRPRSFLYPTGGGTLGYGLPAGIGAKVAQPDKPVVVLQGDGGTMFTVAELATAAQLGLPLPIVVVDNGGYGEIRNEMADRGETVHAVALGHPDFVALAESLGCRGVEIVSPAGLTKAITEAFDADRPTLLHVRENSRAAKGMW